MSNTHEPNAPQPHVQKQDVQTNPADWANGLVPGKLPDKHQPRILCLRLPNWPIQRLIVSQPELRRQRVVLFRRDSRRGQLVAAVSPLAMRGAVCVDMPLSEAKSLLKDRSGTASTRVHIFEHHRATDLAALKELADSLESFSPIVGLEQTGADAMIAAGKRRSLKKSKTSQASNRQPDSIFLDVTGLAHLFGDEHQLAQQLFLHCDAIGYLTRIAIASTVGASWGVATFGRTNVNSQPQNSQPQNSQPQNSQPQNSQPQNSQPQNSQPQNSQPQNSQPQNNEANHHQPRVTQQHVQIVPPADQVTFPALPVDALRLHPATVETLYQLGLKTIAQVLRLPRSDLAMRFGNEIHQRLDQASGQLEESIVARHKPPQFQSQQVLDYPTHHRKTIDVIIARLVTDLCQQLRAQQQGALQWTVRLMGADQESLQVHVNLFQPTATLSHVMPLIEMQLEQARDLGFQPESSHRIRAGRPSHSTQAGSLSHTQAGSLSQARKTRTRSSGHALQVQEIIVSVTTSVLLVEQQRQLFDENPRLDKQCLADLINRLTSRLGQPNVVYPTLLAGAQPEYSFRFRPLVDLHRQRRKATKPLERSHVAGRPMRIFQPVSIRRSEVGVRVGDRRPETGGRKSPAEAFPIPTSHSDLPLRPPTSDLPFHPSPALPAYQISVGNVNHQVVQHWGPERIETGWWRGTTVCRDYWRVETETGRQLWIFQDRRSREWFLHGEF